jgi:DNA invertase Pin-like site-specific DNA recombinase
MNKVAIYIRLSNEDRDKSSKEDDSESIKNQKHMLVKYALEQDWEIYSIYSDDNFSGGTNERPDFKRLIEDAKKQKFDIVLCKSQSRFTRNIETVEAYIHTLFPTLGIRFVSVVDNVDTHVSSNRKTRQVNALVNEWYIEDLSKNVKMTMHHQRKQGMYVSSFACYGYKKDKNDIHKLVVDEPAAMIVRTIYNMYIEGMGYQAIAKYLNNQNIVSPTAYKQTNGSKYHNGNHKHTQIWTPSTIAYILRKQTYCGDMVQGCYEKESYKSKKKTMKPKEEWIIVQDTHQPIISREQFQQVQNRIHKHAGKKRSKETNILVGKLFCGHCNHALRFQQRNTKQYYSCLLHYLNKESCTGCHISYQEIEEMLISEIQEVFALYFNETSVTKELHEQKIGNENKVTHATRLQLDNLMEEKKALYLDKINNSISEEEYLFLSKKKQQEIETINLKLQELTKQNGVEVIQRNSSISQILETYKNMQTVSRYLIEHLIKRVEIYKQEDKKRIKIEWFF